MAGEWGESKDQWSALVSLVSEHSWAIFFSFVTKSLKLDVAGLWICPHLQPKGLCLHLIPNKTLNYSVLLLFVKPFSLGLSLNLTALLKMQPYSFPLAAVRIQVSYRLEVASGFLRNTFIASVKRLMKALRCHHFLPSCSSLSVRFSSLSLYLSGPPDPLLKVKHSNFYPGSCYSAELLLSTVYLGCMIATWQFHLIAQNHTRVGLGRRWSNTPGGAESPRETHPGGFAASRDTDSTGSLGSLGFDNLRVKKLFLMFT